jgi:hypothetical protein
MPLTCKEKDSPDPLRIEIFHPSYTFFLVVKNGLLNEKPL